MKRMLTILLCFTILLSLVGCGNGQSKSLSHSTENNSPVTEPTTFTTPLSTHDELSPTSPPHSSESTPLETPIPPSDCVHTYKNATCTTPKTCSKCNATEGVAAGHNWVDATCTAPKTCSKCNATEGAAAGHNWVDATCTTPKTCSKCNATEGAAAGHNWVNATCTTPKTCSKCNATVGTAAGHNWINATCTAPKTCSKCNATEGAAAGHNWVNATCTTPKTCSKCNATVGTAAGHNWINATCTAPKTCSKCNATEGAAAGHNWVDATCTAPKTCSKCNTTAGTALGHYYVDSKCSRCGKQQESFPAITSGIWLGQKASNDKNNLYDIELDFRNRTLMIGIGANINMFDAEIRDHFLSEYNNGNPYIQLVDGIYYYFGEGDGGNITTYSISGDTITVDCQGGSKLTLMRIAAQQLKITSIQGMSSAVANAILNLHMY